MRFDVTTLGTGAALAARGRYPSAQLLNIRERLYLVDCGEGTQERLRQAGINFGSIARVLVSHMHGDHYLGLMGLISSMHLQGRTTALYLHGPAELREVIELQLRVSRTYLRFPLHYATHEHRTGAPVFTDNRVEVTALALDHRLECTGYLFREAPLPRKLRRDKLEQIPLYARKAVKAGEHLTLPDGSVVPNAELTLDAPPQRVYAYCSDTAYAPQLADALRGVDLLYHEATFTEALAARAKETKHSTARQAGMLAKEAGVKKLLLGHFSSRYKSAEELVMEAREVFPDTLAAEEGRTFPV
ncbi:MAG: ribonuclease Z [Flavobacteriales bacterium]|jgi:ribonuclease Z|nr:ribonuclease Z [Flavobacteriales bacterium]